MNLIQSQNSQYLFEIALLQKEKNFWIGLVFCLCAVIIVASGSVIQKKAKLRLQDDPKWYQIENNFLRDPLWWFGFSLISLGEFFLIAAYAFAPVCLIAPLCGLLIILKATLAKFILYESLNVISQIGCAISVIGLFLIVVHTPKLLHDPLSKLVSNLGLPPAISIITVTILVVVFTATYIERNYYTKIIFIYVILCSALQTLSVISYKYLGLLVKEAIVSDINVLDDYKPYLFLISSIACYIIQKRYVIQCAQLFYYNIVESLSYALCTTLALTVSAVIFEEWRHLAHKDVQEIWLGFVLILIGMFLLHWFHAYSIDWKNLKPTFQMKEDAMSGVGIDFN